MSPSGAAAWLKLMKKDLDAANDTSKIIALDMGIEAIRAGYYNEELIKSIKGILLFCDPDGKPYDGFRFREEIERARKLIEVIQ